MKTLQRGTLFLLVSILPACGQQLVEFGLTATPGEMAVTADLGSSPDLAMSPDLASVDASRDASSPSDMMSMDGPVDLSSPPGPLQACASMLGPAAQSFAVLGGSTVTNTGATTVISGNIGCSPGNAIVGIPVGMPIGGAIHAADAVAAQAQVDVTNVYTCTQAAVCNMMLTGTDLGGLTLSQGVYCFTSSAALNGTLVLDAKGDPNAIWFIQVMSTLDLADNARVHIIHGGKDCNVYWQVGSSVTLGKDARLVGNLLAMASITLDTGASVSGRALARSGAVTMDTNDVAVPSCP